MCRRCGYSDGFSWSCPDPLRDPGRSAAWSSSPSRLGPRRVLYFSGHPPRTPMGLPPSIRFLLSSFSPTSVRPGSRVGDGVPDLPRTHTDLFGDPLDAATTFGPILGIGPPTFVPDSTGEDMGSTHWSPFCGGETRRRHFTSTPQVWRSSDLLLLSSGSRSMTETRSVTRFVMRLRKIYVN